MATTPQQHHYTPPWLDWIATNVVPGAMIGAEFIIGSLFYVVTSVRDPYTPSKWSVLEWALVIVAGFVGLAMAGLALKLSGMAAEMLASSRYIRGLFTFGGVLILALIETWAGIVERASLVGVGPADLLLADYTGIDAFRHIPTSVFMVSFLLPCLVLWYGWASRPPVVISAEEQAATHHKKLADARFKAEMRAIQAGGLGAMLGGGLRAAKQAATGEQSGGNEGEEAADNVTPFRQVADEGSGGFGSRAPTSTPGPKGIRKGQWTSSNLREYALSTYGVNVTKDAAQGAMSALFVMGKAKKVGNRYVATEATIRGWVDGKYGDAQATGTGER